MTIKLFKREDITETNKENGKEYTLRAYIYSETNMIGEHKEAIFSRAGKPWWVLEDVEEPLQECDEEDKKEVEGMMLTLRQSIIDNPAEEVEKVLQPVSPEVDMTNYNFAQVYYKQ